MLFRNPANNYVEESAAPWLFTLLFGFFYFAVKGIWTHVLISVVLAFCTFGVSWLVYPFFANGIVRTYYRRKGWIEIGPDQFSTARPSF